MVEVQAIPAFVLLATVHRSIEANKSKIRGKAVKFGVAKLGTWGCCRCMETGGWDRYVSLRCKA